MKERRGREIFLRENNNQFKSFSRGVIWCMSIQYCWQAKIKDWKNFKNFWLKGYKHFLKNDGNSRKINISSTSFHGCGLVIQKEYNDKSIKINKGKQNRNWIIRQNAWLDVFYILTHTQRYAKLYKLCQKVLEKMIITHIWFIFYIPIICVNL